MALRRMKKVLAVIAGFGGAVMLGLLGWRWLVHREAKKPIADLNDMASCKRCHILLGARAGLNLILHLRDAHKMSEEQAIRKVEEAYKRILR